MKTKFVTDNSLLILYLAKFKFSNHGPKGCWPVKLQDIFELMNNDIYFWYVDKQGSSIILSYLVCIVRHI